MATIKIALIWAVGIMLVALAGIAGLIPDRIVTALVTTLPLVMVTTMTARRCREA